MRIGTNPSQNSHGSIGSSELFVEFVVLSLSVSNWLCLLRMANNMICNINDNGLSMIWITFKLRKRTDKRKTTDLLFPVCCWHLIYLQIFCYKIHGLCFDGHPNPLGLSIRSTHCIALFYCHKKLRVPIERLQPFVAYNIGSWLLFLSIKFSVKCEILVW